MGMYLNLGNTGFQSVRKGNYVDKSGLISFMNGALGTLDKLVCVSRPRRFGKSIAAKMLCAYYDKSCDSRSLFEDLEIAEDPSFEEHLNRYDVIYLDITWFIPDAVRAGETVSNMQRKVIRDLCDQYPDAAGEDSLPETMARIHELTGNKFIVIIDEWDVLFRETKNEEDVQKEYIHLLRRLFKSSLTDKMIEGAYMTGILPIKKYGTQSAMTDFREYTMLSPDCLAEYTGFTEKEVRMLCVQYDMDMEKMGKWYNGYFFSGVGPVYNPNSVMQAMRRQKFGSYWTKTETYESLRVYIDMDMDGLEEAIAQMIGDGHCTVDTDTFQNDMTNLKSRDDILTLLVHLGYLAYEEESGTVFIPNEEIQQEFVRTVRISKHKEIADLIRVSDELLQDTLAMNGEKVAAVIEQAHSALTAPNFYNNEQALRSVVRFAYISCIEEYNEIQELASGTGYADIVYLPKKSSAMPVLVIELKWNRSAEGAVSQIKDRNYPQVLEGYGCDILLVGISYNEKTKKHTCVIEKHVKQKI